MRKRLPLLPRRTARTPGPRERVVGHGILLSLAGLLALFVVAGGRPGPPSLQAREAPPPTAEGPLALRSPGGWPRGPIEHYDVDGLFEKINGKADAYIAFDVVDLTFAGYARPDDPSQYVDVYLYDMAEALNAYGIYRSQRSGKEAALDVQEEGCQAGSACFARKGRWYLEVVGSEAGVAGEARAVLQAVLAALPAVTQPVGDPDWFPPEGRTRVRYARSNALGVASLEDAFTARYEDGTDLLVARCDSPQAAADARAEARETFEFLGTPATFTVLGSRVLGAVGGTDAARRAALLDALRTRLEAQR